MADRVKVRNLVQKTGNWFKNATKSSLLISKDIIKEMMPATFSIPSEIANMARDFNSEGSKGSDAFKTVKTTMDSVKEAMSNAKECLKKGDLYGLTTDDLDMDFDFDDDINFDNLFDFDAEYDEDGSLVEPDPEVKTQQAIIRTAGSQIKATRGQTTALVNVMATNAATSNKISVGHTKAMLTMGNQVLSGLSTINENLGLLVRFQSETMSNFVTTSFKYYNDQLEISKKLMEIQGAIGGFENKNSYSNSWGNSILDSTTGININKYVQQVKKNFSESKDSSMVSVMAQMLLDPDNLNMIKKNPMLMISPILAEAFIPKKFKKNAIKFDDLIKNAIPTILSGIRNWEDRWDNPILRFIGGNFGIDNTVKKKIDVTKVTRGPIRFDGETKNMIGAILVYQRKILSALTGQEELIYDQTTNKFRNLAEVNKKYKEDYMQRAIDMDVSSNINYLADSMNKVLKFNSWEEMDKIRKSLNSVFMDAAKTGNHFKIGTESGISDFVGKYGADLNNNIQQALTAALQAMPIRRKMELFGPNMIAIRENINGFMKEIEENPGVYGNLFNKDGEYEFNPGTISVSEVGSKRGMIRTTTGRFAPDRVDKYGYSMFDYMRDLKTILLKGIRVFPIFRHLDGGSGGPDPTDYLDRMLREMQEDYLEFNVTDRDKDTFAGFQNNNKNNDEEDIEMKVANMREEMERQMKDYDDPDPDGNPQSLFGRFIRFMGRTTGLNKHGPFKKVGKFIRNTSDIATGTLDDIENFIFKVIFGMEEDGEPFHKKVGREFNVLFTNFRKNFSKAVFGDENSLGDKIEDGKGLVNYAVEEVQKGFHSFSNLLFGKEIDEGNEALQTKSFNEIKQTMQKNMPRLTAGALIGAGTTMLGGGTGLLTGLFLPGGPIGGAILGSTISMLSQSDKFKEFLFGKMDDNGERMGGLLAKDQQEFMKKNSKAILIGSSVGALKAAIMGNGALMGSLFGAGPIGGAIVGAGVGLLTQTEKFKSFLFGELGKDGKRDNTGIIKKINNNLNTTYTDLVKKTTGLKDVSLGKTGAGAIGGAISSVALGQMGLLGSLMTMGGSPILGAMAGAAAGITLSSKNFTEAIFGKLGEDGKRKGGKLNTVKNWLSVNVGDPLKLQIQNYSNGIEKWFDLKVADPLRKAINPLIDGLHSAVNSVTHFVKSGISKLVKGLFKKAGGSILGKALRGGAKLGLGALKGLGWLATKSVQHTITTPIKAMTVGATVLGRAASNFDYKRDLKQKLENGEISQEEYELALKDKRAKKQHYKDYKDSRLSEEEKKAQSKRTKNRIAKQKRLEEQKEQLAMKQELAEQMGYKDFNEAGQDISWLYGKDVKYERKDGKIVAKRMQPKTQTEENTDVIKDNTTKIRESIEKVSENIEKIIEVNSTGNKEAKEGVAKIVLSNQESSTNIISNAKKEDVEDDAQLYEVMGYDRKGNKKRRRRDIDYFNENKDSNNSDDKYEAPKNKGKKAKNLFEKIFSGGKSILSSLFSGSKGILKSILAGGIGAIAVTVASALKDGFERNEGIRTNAEGEVIENVSSKRARLNLGRNKIAKPILNKLATGPFKKFLKNHGWFSDGAKDIAESTLREGVEATVKEGAEATVKNTVKDGLISKAKTKSKGLLSKISGKFVKDAGEEALESTVEAAAKTAIKEAGEEVAENATKKVARTGISAVFKGGTKAMKEYLSEIVEKAIKSLAEVFANKSIAKQLGGEAYAQLAKESFEKAIREALEKVLSSSTLLKKVVSKIGEGTIKTISTVASAGLIGALFAAWDLATGCTKKETADLFKVNKDEIDFKMRLISGLFKMVFGISFMPVIDILLDLVSAFSGNDLKQKLATTIYKKWAGAKSSDFKELEQNQAAFLEEVDKYNKENQTKMSVDAYSDMVNRGKKKKGGKGTVKEASNKAKKLFLKKVNSGSMAGYSAAFAGKGPDEYVSTNASDYTDSKYKTETINNTSLFSDLSNNLVFGGKGPNAGKANTSSGGSGSNDNIEPSVVNDFAYFSQLDSRWAYQEYKPSGGGSFSDPYIKQRACGPTSAAMVVTQLTGKRVTPPEMCEQSTQMGCSVDAGTLWDFYGKIGEKYGLNVQYVNPTEAALAAVTPKTPMIISGSGGDLFYGGHFVVGVKGSDDGIIINDPVSSAKSKKYPLSTIASHAAAGWVFSGGDGDYAANNANGDSSSSSDSSSASSSSSSSSMTSMEKLSAIASALSNSLIFGEEFNIDNILSGGDTETSDGSSTPSSASGSLNDGNDKHRLSYISAKYETGGYDPAAIGYDSGGGYSYGLFQFAQNVGGLSSFLSYLQQNYPKLYNKLQGTPGTETFNNSWRKLCETDRDEFITAQENCAKQSYYDPVVANVPSARIDKRNIAVRQIAFSSGVQHGSGGATDIWTDVIGANGTGIADSAIIRAVNTERKNYLGRLTPAEQVAVRNRLDNEVTDALEILKETGGKGAPDPRTVLGRYRRDPKAKKINYPTGVITSSLNKTALKSLREKDLSNPKILKRFAGKGDDSLSSTMTTISNLANKRYTITNSSIPQTYTNSTILTQLNSKDSNAQIYMLLEAIISYLDKLVSNGENTTSILEEIKSIIPEEINLPEITSATANLFKGVKDNINKGQIPLNIQVEQRQRAIDKVIKIAKGGRN